MTTPESTRFLGCRYGTRAAGRATWFSPGVVIASVLVWQARIWSPSDRDRRGGQESVPAGSRRHRG